MAIEAGTWVEYTELHASPRLGDRPGGGVIKPAPFEYHAPTTVDEAISLLAELGDDAKILAGGQSLIPMLAMRLTRFEHLVDIGRIPALRSIEHAGDDAGDGGGGGAVVTVGAMVRQHEIEESAEVARSIPLLHAATPLIGHFQIRSRGTVGGSIAHADPAAEYPAVALALDADLEIIGPDGRRTVPAHEFFQGLWSTSVADGEILTAVRFPQWGPGSGFAVEEVARRHGDFAIVGAACGIQVTDGSISRASIALFGMDHVPRRATSAEIALVGTAAEHADLLAAGQLAIDGLEPSDDLHASGALRLRIGAAVVRRALTTALARATEQPA
ncbi:MAG TPA: xanthine dehydrogenase family protein subunit M [Ilumatobacter sp.]|nr:xanthine dehydrogenase family protein subunit M [Ilumatobacter sp.]